MSDEEIKLFEEIAKQLRERLDVKGQCKLLSIGYKCTCSLCLLDSLRDIYLRERKP